MEKRDRKRSPWYYLRFVIALALVVVVVSRLDLSNTWETIKQVNVWLYVIIFCIFLLNKLITTYRWKLLLISQNIKVKLSSLYKLYLVGFMFNIVLPSSIGGDVVKIYKLGKDVPENKFGSAMATIMDRFGGLVALPIIIFITILFNPYLELKVRLIVFVCIAILFCLLALVLRGNVNWLINLIRKIIPGKKLKNLFDKCLSATKVYKKDKKTLFKVLLLSLVFQIIGILNQYLIFYAIGVKIPLIFMFMVVPVTRLIVSLPISIGGIGVKEISLIGLLGVIGVTNFEVVSYSLLAYSLNFVLIIFAGLYLGGSKLFNSKQGKTENFVESDNTQ